MPPLRDGKTVGEEPTGPTRRDELSQFILCRSSLVAFPSLHDEKEFLQPAGGVKLRCRFASSRVILVSFSTDLTQYFRVNGHVVIPILAKLSRTPAILDLIEGVLGPNLLVWLVELFIKDADNPHTVSWHQDITYWGMGETDDEATAWLALNEVSVEAGFMRLIPGSHKGGIAEHQDTFAKDNLLSRGQSIAGINENVAQNSPLKPGQMSLHHGRCFHASGANSCGDRRIGLEIRYLTPAARDHAPGCD